MDDVPRPDSPGSISSLSGTKLRATDSVSAHPLLAGGSDLATSLPTEDGTATQVKHRARQRGSDPPAAFGMSPPTTSTSSTATASLSQSVSASAPTSNGVSETSPSQATFKLQIQSLQAAVQVELGLSNESAGWALLQRLINQPVSRQADRLWADLVTALTSGKVALVLPKEPLPINETVTSGFLADHCFLVDPTSVNAPRLAETYIATLSGLRGSILPTKEQLQFSSLVPIPAETDNATVFASEAVQRSLLGEPVHRPETPLPSKATKYTNFWMSAKPTTLSIPQQQNLSLNRPTQRASGSSPSTTSKLASLFGSKTSSASSSLTTSPHQPLEAESTSASASSTPLSVVAYAIDRLVRRPDVAKGISRAAEARVRIRFAERWPRTGSQARKAAWDEIIERCLSVIYAFQPPKLSNWSTDAKGKASLYHAKPDDVAAALQDLYEQVIHILLRPVPRRRPSVPSLPDQPQEIEVADGHDRVGAEEADTVLGAVEDVITTELYDRLFCPSISQDAIDDENLAARIAGLNLLEISLDHLGIAIESSNETDIDRDEIINGLAALVQACGQELRRLQDPLNTSPRQKLEVLVAAHKLIVDRIALLPPLPQKPDAAATTPTPRSSQEIELSDDARSLSARSEPTTPLRDHAVQEATPRPSSRAPSISDANVPEIKLPSSAMNGHSYFETQHTVSKSRSAASSADVILPVLIWCILQANPHRLVSDLLFIERFHAEGLLKGESGYCLVNFQAVLEFLLHVDLGALGLGAQSDRLIAALPDATPSQVTNEAGSLRFARDRVSSEVASFALAAGKGLVGLGGAVEDGYRMLGGLLARSTASLDAARQPKAVEGVRSILDNISPTTSPTLEAQPKVGRQTLLRQSSNPLLDKSGGLLLARHRSKSDLPQRELQEVSPAGPGGDVAPSSPSADTDAELKNGRSGLGSLLSSADRPSLGDRLASLARFGSPDKQGTPSKVYLLNTILYSAHHGQPLSRPPSVMAASPLAQAELRSGAMASTEELVAPPIERFLLCGDDDLRLGEVASLLAEYRRLAGALARRGLFASP